jgi:hypothetical protein
VLSAERGALAASLEESRLTGRRLQDQLASAEDRARDATRQRDAFQAQLVAVGRESRSAAEDRIELEVRVKDRLRINMSLHVTSVSLQVRRLRESSAKELDDIRSATREGYERELATLREARADAVAEAQRLALRLDALQARPHGNCLAPCNAYPLPLQRSLDEGSAAQREAAAIAETTIAELRAGLKMKAFECERMQLSAAEKADALARMTAEADRHRERATLLQVRHYVISVVLAYIRFPI